MLMQKVRSSYGTFGVVYEVTYRIRQLLRMAVYHETYTLEGFVAQLDQLKGRGKSMMYYIFPFADRITIEFRRYNPGASGSPNRSAWALRNYLWGTAGPRLAHDVEEKIPLPKIRYEVIDGFNALIRFKLGHLIRADYIATRPDHRLPARLGQQPVHLQPVRLSGSRIRPSAHRVHCLRSRLLRSAGLPFQLAICGIPDCPGPEGAVSPIHITGQ